MKKTSREKDKIKDALRFSQSSSLVKSDERLGKPLNSAFKGKHKGQNSFAYLKNKRTYLDRTEILY